MKKHIRIKFVDFWDDFIPENNLFYQILAERYDVELSDEPEYLFYSVFGEEYLRMPLSYLEDGHRATLLAEMKKLGVL